MYKDKKILAIIPARSGSKGIKDKNIIDLNGKPMIAYTIEAAIKSNIFTDIIVSTDSEKYAEVSRKNGASVPFLRPGFLSEDNSNTIDMILYTLKELENQNKYYDYFMLLQPTSPLRDEIDIINSIKILFKYNANSVISVNECESPRLMNTLDDSFNMENFIDKKYNKRRQDLEKYYKLNGAIYLSKVDIFLKENSFYTKNSKAYIMSKRNSIDIDDYIDFKIAECILKEETNV